MSNDFTNQQIVISIWIYIDYVPFYEVFLNMIRSCAIDV